MIQQAAKYGRVHVVTNSGGKYTTIKARDTWTLTESPSYVHYCANETVHGINSRASMIGTLVLIGING
jgi:phosphoserine aminotransferase